MNSPSSYFNQANDYFNKAQGTLGNIKNQTSQYLSDRDTTNNNLQNQFGVNDTIGQLQKARMTLFNTQNMLNTLPTDVNNRLQSGGGLMTQGQRNRILSSEQTPLSQQVSNQSNSVNAQSSNLDTVNSYINSILGRKRQDYLDTINPEQAEANNFMTGYGTSSGEGVSAGQQQTQRDIEGMRQAGQINLMNAQMKAQKDYNSYLGDQAQKMMSWRQQNGFSGANGANGGSGGANVTWGGTPPDVDMNELRNNVLKSNQAISKLSPEAQKRVGGQQNSWDTGNGVGDFINNLLFPIQGANTGSMGFDTAYL